MTPNQIVRAAMRRLRVIEGGRVETKRTEIGTTSMTLGNGIFMASIDRQGRATPAARALLQRAQAAGLSILVDSALLKIGRVPPNHFSLASEILDAAPDVAAALAEDRHFGARHG